MIFRRRRRIYTLKAWKFGMDDWDRRGLGSSSSSSDKR